MRFISDGRPQNQTGDYHMMKISVSGLLLEAAAMTLAAASSAQAGAIAPNATPISFNSGFGDITVGGQLSVWLLAGTTHQTAFRRRERPSMSPTRRVRRKTNGMFQFYVQAGLYSFPTVGVPV